MKFPVYEPEITEREIELVTQTIRDGWIGSKGPFVRKFETLFAEWIGADDSLTSSNGTCSLHLAVEALGLGEGDEILVPNLTFIATANVVVFAGAKPVFVDIEPTSFGMDPEQIKSKITSKTRAIMPVHLYGHPAKMDEIMKIAKENDLFVIEDASEAIGAKYKGKEVGTIGDIGCFSFYGNKIITTGEGGMLVSNNPKLIKKAFDLREQGMSEERRYWHNIIGYNYKMTSLQAAFGVAQLERIDSIIERKRNIATWYEQQFDGSSKLEFFGEQKWAKSVFWMNSILLEDGIERDGIMLKLLDIGIETRPFFYPINKMPPYFTHETFSVSEEISKKGINLPSSATLTKEDVEFISSSVLRLLGE